MIRKLTEAECRAAVENGDFDTAFVAGPATAIILTQSWCPQWTDMKKYLPQVEAALSDIRIYYVEYDVELWESLENKAFMNFKENIYNNREIPYVRYYRNGIYNGDSNYISQDDFKSRLG